MSSRKGGLTGIASLMLLVFITACHSSKKATKQKVVTDTVSLVVVDTTLAQPKNPDRPKVETPSGDVGSTAAAKMRERVEAYKPIWSQVISYKTFTGKAQMSYTANNETKDFTANFRIAKGQGIWVHVAALGGMVNVARALITPDSIKAMVYLNKEFIALPLSDAAKLLPVAVEYQSLENLIIGNPLLETGAPLEMTEVGTALSFLFQKDNTIQNLVYNKANNYLRSMQLKVASDNAQDLSIQMGNHSSDANHFSQARSIGILANRKQVLVTMDFKDYAFDEAVDMPFTIPKSYKRMQLK